MIPYLAGNFRPVSVETTAFDLKIVGHVPEELDGRFLRIGPNPVAAPDPQTGHWFAGSGMVHGLRLRHGAAEWYRNRFVLGPREAEVLGRVPIPGPGAGERARSPNTNIVQLGGKTYAIVEAGSLPVELDDELNSVAHSDLGGSLEAGFSAHPKWDAATRTHHVLAYEAGSPLRYIVADTAGKARTIAKIDLPHCPLVHDVAMTQSSVVILDLPTTFQPDVATTVIPWIWNDRQAARVGLLPRTGDVDKLQWFEAPRCFVFHFLNAYDQGDRVIADVVRHPRMFASQLSWPNEGKPTLVRWTLDRHTGSLSESLLDDHGCEFPRISGAVEGIPYRFGYSAHWNENVVFGPAFKHDVDKATTQVHDYGPGRATLEPVFVRRQDCKAEDDGWILSYVYDAMRDKSDVVILDAQNFTGDPVATIQLPVRVPFGFHGGWVPAR